MNNMVDKTRLVKASTYAIKIGKSITWVYKLIAEGELQTEKIDGKVFVVVPLKTAA